MPQQQNLRRLLPKGHLAWTCANPPPWAPCPRSSVPLVFLYVFVLKPALTAPPTELDNVTHFDTLEGRPWQVYLYANRSEVEPEALQQLISLAESPLPVGYVSAMPDVHVGKGVTVRT